MSIGARYHSAYTPDHVPYQFITEFVVTEPVHDGISVLFRFGQPAVLLMGDEPEKDRLIEEITGCIVVPTRLLLPRNQ